MTKARNLYLLLARDASTDSNDSMNTITKIIDIFNASRPKNTKNDDSVSGIPISYSIASLWLLDKTAKKNESYKVVFETLDTKGENIGSFNLEYTPPFETKRLSFNAQANALPARREGEYTLKATLYKGNEVLASAEYPYALAVEWVEQENA